MRSRFSSCARVWNACDWVDGGGLRAVSKGESLGRELLGQGLYDYIPSENIAESKDNMHHLVNENRIKPIKSG